MGDLLEDEDMSWERPPMQTTGVEELRELWLSSSSFMLLRVAGASAPGEFRRRRDQPSSSILTGDWSWE